MLNMLEMCFGTGSHGSTTRIGFTAKPAALQYLASTS